MVFEFDGKRARPMFKRPRGRPRLYSDEERIERAKMQNRRWRDKKLAAIRRLKSMKGCSRCGYRKCGRSLVFHHLDPSQKEVRNWAELTERALHAELKKCVVLCANCHGEVHDLQEAHVE